MKKRLVIRFDGPPSHESGRFIEVELDGASVSYGEWEQDGDDWLLVLPDADAKVVELTAEMERRRILYNENMADLAKNQREQFSRAEKAEAELEWRRREMERAMDAMHDGEYQWQEDDAKAMGQTVEGICETMTRLKDVEADNRLLAKQILGEARELDEALRK